MDHQTFDHATRVFAASGSRRAAWRALLGAALLGATTRTASAGPCDTGKNPACTCGTDTKCPPGKCFTHDCGHQHCCSEPTWITCGNRCCKTEDDNRPIPDPCGRCIEPVPPDAGPGPCEAGITGSYRRR
jgi:hypothetical protein